MTHFRTIDQPLLPQEENDVIKILLTTSIEFEDHPIMLLCCYGRHPESPEYLKTMQLIEETWTTQPLPGAEKVTHWLRTEQ